jgi:sec-independent protein translocase protein TatC
MKKKTDANDEIEASSAPLIEHLSELRSRLIWCLLTFVICMILVFPFSNYVFNFLAAPIVQLLSKQDRPAELIFTGMQQGFMVNIKISLFGGFVVAFPLIGFQLWKFVAPGLYNQEKMAFLPFLLASPILFFIGSAFAYYVVLPLAFDFFLSFQNSTNVNDLVGISYLGTINEYLSLTMKFILAFGICFQLPVLLTLLGKVGIVSSHSLSRVRKYAMVAILIISALVTPPDVITQLILFSVVYSLYEVSIILVKMVEKKRDKILGDLDNENLS